MNRLLSIAIICSGQVLYLSAGVDLSGIWKGIASSTEIRQTATTFALRPIVKGSKNDRWYVFPTDGTVLSEKRIGHRATLLSGHWIGDKLFLQTSSEGNLPWVRSKTIEIFSLSGNGRTLTISFRLDPPERDYDAVLEKTDQ